MPAGGHRKPPGNFRIHGVYGRVLLDGRGLYTNDPSSHADSIGLPPGHPPLESFLGAPLIQDGKVIGMVAVANREGGYGKEQLRDLEDLAPSMVQALSRKRAEQALRESEELVRTIAENSTQALMMMDDRGYCTYSNQSWLDMTGYTAEEIRSKPLHDLVHDRYPDGRPYPIEECPLDRALPENFNVRARTKTSFSERTAPCFRSSARPARSSRRAHPSPPLLRCATSPIKDGPRRPCARAKHGRGMNSSWQSGSAHWSWSARTGNSRSSPLWPLMT